MAIKRFCDRCDDEIPETEVYYSGKFESLRRDGDSMSGFNAELCSDCWDLYVEFINPKNDEDPTP